MTTTLLRPPTTTAVTSGRDAQRLGTILGVWAHPDDEAYLSAGLMALARAAGSRVVCVTATHGEHGTDDPAGFPPHVLAELRRTELAASLAALDVHEHRFLGFEDGTLADQDPGPAIARIRAMIAWFQPDTIVTFGPEGMTGHPDHRAISSWTTEAWRRSSRQARLLHATTTASFADEFADLHDLVPVFGPGLPRRVPDEEVAVTVHLDGVHLDRKLAALHAHASQVGVLVEAFGAARFRHWWRTECFTEVAR